MLCIPHVGCEFSIVLLQLPPRLLLVFEPGAQAQVLLMECSELVKEALLTLQGAGIKLQSGAALEPIIAPFGNSAYLRSSSCASITAQLRVTTCLPDFFQMAFRSRNIQQEQSHSTVHRIHVVVNAPSVCTAGACSAAGSRRDKVSLLCQMPLEKGVHSCLGDICDMHPYDQSFRQHHGQRRSE